MVFSPAGGAAFGLGGRVRKSVVASRNAAAA